MSKKSPNPKQKKSLKQLPEVFGAFGAKISRYKIILFVVFIAAVYGFVLFHLSQDNNAQPTDDQISAQTSPIATAHIDKTVVAQLEKLQDNSVSVNTLFQQARNNPFQE
jgi:hypothetical protein